MPTAAISESAALVVIDLQAATAGLSTKPLSPAGVAEQAATLARAFRAKKLPVVWVNVGGAPAGRTESQGSGGAEFPIEWTQLMPELGVDPADQTFTKQSWGAFHDGRFEDLLAGLGARQLVLAGVATSAGVESTARGAYDKGFDVVVVTDAVADMSVEAHEASIANVFPAIGETATVEDVINLLGAP